jgi:hypothetical protein
LFDEGWAGLGFALRIQLRASRLEVGCAHGKRFGPREDKGKKRKMQSGLEGENWPMADIGIRSP